MEKRYQVFVSSTFTDLKEAREEVFKTLMSMECFPAGMELFPAMDQEQFDFIKRVIDASDYYLLIMGARYGSLSPQGLSYTEMEFDYAIGKGLKVLAFLHEKPDEIAAKFTEGDPELREKLAAFRHKVSTGRLVSFWKDPRQLPGLVMHALNRTTRTYPAIGWVRADKVASEVALQEQNELLKEVERLKFELMSIKALNQPMLDDIAGLDEVIRVPIYWHRTVGGMTSPASKTIEITWGNLFKRLAPEIHEYPADGHVNFLLGQSLLRIQEPYHNYSVAVEQEVFKTIRLQLIALGLVTTSMQTANSGDRVLFWSLTGRGTKTMFELGAVKSRRPTNTGIQLGLPKLSE